RVPRTPDNRTGRMTIIGRAAEAARRNPPRGPLDVDDWNEHHERPDPKTVLQMAPPNWDDVEEAEFWHRWRWWALHEEALQGHISMAAVLAHRELHAMLYSSVPASTIQ